MNVGFWRQLGWRAILSACIAALALSAPSWISDTYVLHLFAVASVTSIAAMSLNLLVGVSGQISLAHAAFLGLGGYTTAILTTKVGWGFWSTSGIALVIGAAAGVVLGLPSLRLRGHYLGMVTLGAGQIFAIAATTAVGITGGANGIAGIPAPSLGGPQIVADGQLLQLFAIVALICYLLLSAVRASQPGRIMSVIRQDETAAASLGIAPRRYKLLAFVISSALASFAGSLLVGLLGVASPASFSVNESILLLVMVVIGGLRSIGGAAIGAIVVTLLPEYLRFLDTWYQVAFGIAIILLSMFAPGGIVELVTRGAVKPAERLLRRLRKGARA